MSLILRSSLRWLTVVAAVMSFASTLGAQTGVDWADSPEAYFLTGQERSEWLAVRASQAERDAFVVRYWLRRDPTPGTEKNEFRDLVRARIKLADERFKIAETDGSRTARGLALVVFGIPARTIERPVPRADRASAPTGPNDGLEIVVIWTYQKDRTPKILEMLGRPELEFTFYIEPERKRDRFDIETKARDLQQIVAARSIVNPEVGGLPAIAAVPPRWMPLALMSDTLPAATDDALLSGRGNERVHFGHATLLGKRQITAWFFVPGDVRLTNARIAGRFVSPDQNAEAIRFSLDVTPTDELLSAGLGNTYGVRIPMPAPGSYSAALALFDSSRVIATAAIAKLEIAPADETGFQISNLAISGGLGSVRTNDDAFAWGDVRILPRSDSTFHSAESLWYFVQVAHPSSVEGLITEVRLRKDNKPHGDATRVAAEAGPIGNGLYLIGRELPLTSLEAGSYSLYVTVIDGANQKVGRADFMVVAPDLGPQKTPR